MLLLGPTGQCPGHDTSCMQRCHRNNVLKGECKYLQVTQLVMAGEWSNSQSKEAMELCMGGCAQIDSVARQCLRQAAVAPTSAG